MTGKFSDVKRAVLVALREGRVYHEARVVGKNLLAIGELTLADTIELVERTRGQQAECGRHHLDEAIEIWILRPEQAGTRWYIKCYQVEADVWFISFHPTEVHSR